MSHSLIGLITVSSRSGFRSTRTQCADYRTGGRELVLLQILTFRQYQRWFDMERTTAERTGDGVWKLLSQRRRQTCEPCDTLYCGGGGISVVSDLSFEFLGEFDGFIPAEIEQPRDPHTWKILYFSTQLLYMNLIIYPVTREFNKRLVQLGCELDQPPPHRSWTRRWPVR